jgi:hypothetical protein
MNNQEPDLNPTPAETDSAARLLPRDLVSRIDAASDICVLVYFDVFGPALSGRS